MSSSSLTCIASESRFCVFWIRNTIRNVMIVVPVLITSCQVSLKRNAGPKTAHAMTISVASTKVPGRPVVRAAAFANRINRERDFMEVPVPSARDSLRREGFVEEAAHLRKCARGRALVVLAAGYLAFRRRDREAMHGAAETRELPVDTGITHFLLERDDLLLGHEFVVAAVHRQHLGLD